MEKQRAKLAVGNLCYVYGSYHREGEIGIVLEVQAGRESDVPHIKFKAPDGQVQIRDYSRVGFGGAPRALDTKAVIKWTFDAFRPAEAIAASEQHMEWPVEQVAGSDFALVRDPWFGRLHWLLANREYRLTARQSDWGGRARTHTVTMEGLLYT